MYKFYMGVHCSILGELLRSHSLERHHLAKKTHCCALRCSFGARWMQRTGRTFGTYRDGSRTG